MTNRGANLAVLVALLSVGATGQTPGLSHSFIKLQPRTKPPRRRSARPRGRIPRRRR